MANDKLAHLIELTAELKRKMQADGKAALKEAFQDFFAKHEAAKSVLWVQFTPHFNDGDACTFAVHEFELKVRDGLIDNDNYSDDYGYGDSCASRYLPLHRDSDLCKDFAELESQLCRIAEVLQTVFDDHVQVRATRKGFSVTEFDHD